MELLINHRSAQPIYIQIVEQIKEMTIKGELKPGDAITSVRAMARELKIGALTVQKAFDILQQDGIIETVVGKGTFISHKYTAGIELQKELAVEQKANEFIETAKKYGITKDAAVKLIKNLY